MSDDASEYSVGIVSGSLMSRCKRCYEPMTGSFDADYDEFKLKCVSCGFKAQFKTKDFFDIQVETIFEG